MTKKLSIVFLFTLILLSCSESQSEYEQATFIIDEVSNTSVTLVKTNEEESFYDLRDTAIYQTSMCLKDATLATPVIDQSFKISINGQQTEYKTDHTGCMTLNFTKEVDMINCEVLEKVPVTIEGLDNYTGIDTLEFALNPTGEKQIFDLRYTQTSYEKLSLKKTCNESKMLIQKLNISRPVSRSTDLLVDINMIPMLQRENIEGINQIQSLSQSADLDIKLQLIGIKNNIREPLKKIKIKHPIYEEQLRISANFGKIAQSIAYDNYDLEISIDSKKSKLKEYTFKVTTDSLSFRKMSDIQEIDFLTTFENRSYDTKSLKNENNINSIGLSKINDIESTFTNIEDDNKQLQSVMINACFVDKHSNYNDPIGIRDISIELQNKEDIKVDQIADQTNIDGCIVFYLEKEYKVFKRQLWNENSIIFKFDDQKVTRNIALRFGERENILKDLDQEKFNNNEIQNNNFNLVVKEANYTLLGKDRESFYINSALELFYKSTYNFKIEPVVMVFNEMQNKLVPKVIENGEMDVKVSILRQNKDNYIKNIAEIDLSQLEVISHATSTAKFEKDGHAHFNIKLPFSINDAHYLAYNSIALVEMSPNDELSDIPTSKYIMKFNSTSESITRERLYAYDGYVGDHNQTTIEMMEREGHAFVRSKTEKINSLKEYKKMMKKALGERFQSMTYKEFSNSTKDSEYKLNMNDMLNIKILKENSKLRTHIAKNLCDYFKINERTRFLTKNKCHINPKEYIKVHNARHVVEMTDITPNGNFDDYALEYGVSRAMLKDGSIENNGTASLGDAFMAAVGSRASTTSGSRDSHAYSLSGSMFYDGPPNIFFLTYGYSYTQEEFVTESDDDMHVEFTRWYSDLNKYKVNYSSFALKFKAKTIRCSLIENIKEQKFIHLCEDRPREYKNLEERWFFLADKDIGKNNVTTDSSRIGDTSFVQIIRGEKNFKKIWKTFENSNREHVVDNLKGRKIGQSFKNFIDAQGTKVEKQIKETSNFPGILR